MDPDSAIQGPLFIYDGLRSLAKRLGPMLSVDDDEIKSEDLYFFYYNTRELDYLYRPAFKDKTIAVYGADEDIPPIRNAFESFHKITNVNGITILEARNSPGLRYAVVNMDIFNGQFKAALIVTPKNKTFRLVRHIKRSIARLNEDQLPPILQKGLLDAVIHHSIGFLINKKKIEKYKVRIRRGVLLHGEPGNGKTMLCKWIRHLCSKHNISYNQITASAILEAFEKNAVAELLVTAQVTFFDDIDISFLSRKDDSHNAKIACSLLGAMDGMGYDDHCVRIFTTNEEVKSIDDAFRRPGRIDECFHIDKPTMEMRLQLVQSWHGEIIQAIEPYDIAEATEGFSFAEVEAVKSLLVTNRLFGTGKWNLERALLEFKNYGTSWVALDRPCGFETEQKQESEVQIRVAVPTI